MEGKNFITGVVLTFNCSQMRFLLERQGKMSQPFVQGPFNNRYVMFQLCRFNKYDIHRNVDNITTPVK